MSQQDALPSWARVGAKVTLRQPIPSNYPCPYGEIIPFFSLPYTIRAIDLGHGSSGGGWVYGLRLSEIHNSPHRYSDGFHECSYWIELFVPIVEDKTEETLYRQRRIGQAAKQLDEVWAKARAQQHGE